MRRLLLFALVLLLPVQALAWGSEGHRIIATLAYERLTPKAQKAVDELILQAGSQGTPACPVASVEEASMWPDCVRETHDPRFSSLSPDHFENAPVCGYQAKTTYCPNGQCVTEATKRALVVLRDPKRSGVERLQALEEVIHFVGDMHQPLHVADNGDRGGNDVRVVMGSEDTNLHHLWDTVLVADILLTDEAAAKGLLRGLINANAATWSRGDIDIWAAESHRVAVQFIYLRLPKWPGCDQRLPPQILPSPYVFTAAPYVRYELAAAAFRLAVVLNSALG